MCDSLPTAEDSNSETAADSSAARPAAISQDAYTDQQKTGKAGKCKTDAQCQARAKCFQGQPREFGKSLRISVILLRHTRPSDCTPNC